MEVIHEMRCPPKFLGEGCHRCILKSIGHKWTVILDWPGECEHLGSYLDLKLDLQPGEDKISSHGKSYSSNATFILIAPQPDMLALRQVF